MLWTIAPTSQHFVNGVEDDQRILLASDLGNNGIYQLVYTAGVTPQVPDAQVVQVVQVLLLLQDFKPSFHEGPMDLQIDDQDLALRCWPFQEGRSGGDAAGQIKHHPSLPRFAATREHSFRGRMKEPGYDFIGFYQLVIGNQRGALVDLGQAGCVCSGDQWRRERERNWK